MVERDPDILSYNRLWPCFKQKMKTRFVWFRLFNSVQFTSFFNSAPYWQDLEEYRIEKYKEKLNKKVIKSNTILAKPALYTFQLSNKLLFTRNKVKTCFVYIL